MTRIATNNASTPLPLAARTALGNIALKLRTALLGTIAGAALLTGLPAHSDYTGRITIEWVRVDAGLNVARVKPKQGISKKASCQSVNYMVIDLSDPNAKTFLATIYTASATKGAKVRLFGAGTCIGGAELVDGVTIFPAG